MITGEVFADEDAQVLVEAIALDYSGEDVNGITNLHVYVKSYKTPSVEAEGATMVYDSTMGQYLLTIPAIYVPGSGIFDVVVRGDDISDVLIRLQVNVADDRLQTIITAIAALNNISVDDILDEIVSASSHTTAGSFARLLYILYCGSIGGVVNTQSARTIKDSTGTTLVTNSITSDTSSVTRTGGHE